MTRTLSLVFVALLAGVASVHAGEGDRVKGLVVERCAECHVVPGEAPAPANVGAPSLEGIAFDHAKYTDARIRASLQQPHWPMTQFTLSPSDIDALVAYFDDLRGAH